MKKILHLISVTAFGWLGWVVGAKIGFLTAYFFSGFASMIGIYVSWKLVRWLEG